jgi:DNA-binding NarL/FixJ family response regulator
MRSTAKTKPNLIIVDDHLIFQQGLITMIKTRNIGTVIGEASNGKDFIELLSYLKPDLILMDIDMPQMDGFVATQKALELIPDLKIIIVSMFGDDDYYYKMIENGVKGFVLKSSGINELETAIKEVMNGESYFSKEILRKIIQNIGNKKTTKIIEKEIFTEREIDVLKQIYLGNTTEEIAQHLNISPKTVKTHRANLLEKTACKNTVSLIVFALRNKIIVL